MLSDGTTVDYWVRKSVRGEPVDELVVPPADPTVELADRVASAVQDLRDALMQLPAPQVQVDAPDLAGIVEAVTALKPSVDAEDIADAIARKLRIPEPPSNEPLVDAITRAFEKLDHRMVGLGKPAFGASGPSNISDNPNRQLGVVSFRHASQAGDGETVSSSGDNTLHTPASGKRVRLRWIYLQAAAANSAAVTATVKLGSSTLYAVELDPNGVSVFSHSTVREGAADAALVVNLSAGQTVLTNFDLEEF